MLDDDAICCMEKHVHNMVRAGLGAEKLDIKLVAKPCEGVPVRAMAGGERPFDVLNGKTGEDARVLRDISVVVVAKKLVAANRQVEGEGSNAESQTNEPLCTRIG